MSMPPKTVLEVSAAEVEAIRHVVRTAAPDNIWVQKGIDAAGFVRMG